MISCTEFIPSYSELFSYLEDHYGRAEVDAFWKYLFVPDGKGIPLINFIEKEGIRVTVDDRNEKIGFKIREAQMQKIPYMLVIGDRDMENGTVSVRTRKGEDLGAMTPDEFIAKCLMEIATKSKEV